MAQAELISALVVERNVTADNVRAGRVTSGPRQDMDADVAKLISHGHMSGLQVWSIVDGRLVYAAGEHDPSETVLPADELSRVRRSGFSSTGRSRAGAKTFDVFVTYGVDGDERPDVVVEVLLADDSINASIIRSTMFLYSGALLVAGIITAAAWRVHRRRRLADYQSRHDRLTGLGNRMLILERISDELAAREDGATLAVAVYNLDGFRQVNETLGHHPADLLVAYGNRLAASCRPTDTVVRLAGDEFAVLLTGLTDGAEIERRVRELGEPARLPVAVGGLDVELEATVGFAPAHSTTADGLLRAAEVALHEAKRAGVAAAAYDPQVDDRDGAQLTTLTELRQAIEHDELVLYYQPKLGREGTVGAVEALVRWQHPQRGLLAPVAFLPLAEQTSLIGPLTAWVLRRAVRRCADWRATGRHLKVAVNISARNLADPDLPELVASALAGAHLPAELLELEITETAVAADPARAVASLKQIRRAGVAISLDDFGTGYTSLAQLSGFPVDGLKIDRTFIRSVDVDGSHQAIVRNVIKLSHDLGLFVVAEGVEDARTAGLLEDLDCDFVQGYLLTPPLAPDALVTWLDTAAPAFAKPADLPSMTGGLAAQKAG